MKCARYHSLNEGALQKEGLLINEGCTVAFSSYPSVFSCLVRVFLVPSWCYFIYSSLYPPCVLLCLVPRFLQELYCRLLTHILPLSYVQLVVSCLLCLFLIYFWGCTLVCVLCSSVFFCLVGTSLHPLEWSIESSSSYSLSTFILGCYMCPCVIFLVLTHLLCWLVSCLLFLVFS